MLVPGGGVVVKKDSILVRFTKDGINSGRPVVIVCGLTTKLLDFKFTERGESKM